MAIVTLTSDFGNGEYYVAVMKGVILSRCPQAKLVDVSHTVSPGDISEGAFVIGQACRYFPAGTIHLIVVDPGVGTERAILAGQFGDQLFVAPDNGVLSWVNHVLPRRALHLVDNSSLWLDFVSQTFHGRDIMSPVAAHLAGGGKLEDVGPATEQMMLFEIPQARLSEGQIIGQVVAVDHYGNLITNIDQQMLAKQLASPLPSHTAVVAGQQIPIGRCYADVPEGQLVALLGSSGNLEIASNRGSAAALLNLGVGTIVRVV